MNGLSCVFRQLVLKGMFGVPLCVCLKLQSVQVCRFSVVYTVCRVTGCLAYFQLLILTSNTALKSFVKLFSYHFDCILTVIIGSKRTVIDLKSCYLLLSLQIGPVSGSDQQCVGPITHQHEIFILLLLLLGLVNLSIFVWWCKKITVYPVWLCAKIKSGFCLVSSVNSCLCFGLVRVYQFSVCVSFPLILQAESSLIFILTHL